MAILRKSYGHVDVSKVDLSLRGLIMLIVAVVILLGAYEGGKWMYAKFKGYGQKLMPDAVGKGVSDAEAALGL